MSDTPSAQAANPEPQAGDGQQMEQEQPKTPLSAEDSAAALKKARDDAADYRRKLREAESKLTAAEKAKADEEAKRAEEQGQFQKLYETEKQTRSELEARLRQIEHDQMRRDAAQAAGIPQLWTRLSGDTAEALAEDATALAAVVAPANGQPAPRGATTAPTPPPQGTGGLTPEERRAKARATF